MSACGLLLADTAMAEPLLTQTYSSYGTPGLIDLPTAEAARDGELAGVAGVVAGQTRTTLTFQIAPRLSGSFRYARIPDFDGPGADRFDRSFDLRFAFLDEGRVRPAVAVGLQDFIGTGLYSAEYFAATKGFGPADRLRVTAGLGWGRLATRNVLARDDAARVDAQIETGGTVNAESLFSGPVAGFAGLRWAATERLALSAEYSSDAYAAEAERGLIAPESPWNLGVDYALAPGVRLSAFALQGAEAGVQIAFTLNPDAPPAGPGLDPAPVPVQARPARSADALGWSGAWAADPAVQSGLRETLAGALDAEGVVLDAVAIAADRATVRIVNTRWAATAQAVGRTMRVMTRILPPSVERFTVVLLEGGIPTAAVSLARSDLEALEVAPADEILARAIVTGGIGLGDDLTRLRPYPRFTYALGPYIQLSLFDPDQPVRGELGLRLDTDLALAPGLELVSQISLPVLSDLDEITRESDSTLPRVRSDFALYTDDLDPRLEQLTLAHFGRPGDTTYSRITAGYLERMYAGLSGELLWKPVDSRLALGVEVNAVRQRAFDDAFALQDYEVVTGHASVYLDMGQGYYGQIDAGRYLAGDVGATITLDRVFGNGWRVGAYATFTDVPFEEFGEGSFDKGIRLQVPLQWFTGQPSRATYATTLRPLTRDGGARLDVADRLYPRVAGDHLPALRDRSGRFWK